MPETINLTPKQKSLIKWTANFLSVFTPTMQMAMGTIFRENKQKIDQGNYDFDIGNHLLKLGIAVLALWGDAVTDGIILLSLVNKEPDYLPSSIEVGNALVKLGLIGAALLSRRK